ncbi:hypothetical protein CPB84DRAFT_1476547 [Gymnopilus junonius]|uniref:Uncharacterized protein n=1 Tax=Gymnopilus junonius TaxID=109634 RepID=A0A9P5TKN3_GYMJU|nr:hypothetical protein CPB84DRAFT_1476547 [Gymnopilus junonius]
MKTDVKPLHTENQARCTDSVFSIFMMMKTGPLAPCIPLSLCHAPSDYSIYPYPLFIIPHTISPYLISISLFLPRISHNAFLLGCRSSLTIAPFYPVFEEST